MELGLDAYAGEDAQLLAAPHVHMKNLLAMPGGIEPDGVPIELSRVKLPACFVSTVEDRIAPWKMTYKGAKHAEYESQAQQEHDRPALLMIFSTLTAARRNK